MRERLAPLLLTFAGTLGCQVGGGDVPIGSDIPTVFYVSPAGDDLNPGTRARPWKTLGYATEQLTPGQTLLLMDGEYRLETTGLLLSLIHI